MNSISPPTKRSVLVGCLFVSVALLACSFPSAQASAHRSANVLPAGGLSCHSSACAEAYHEFRSEHWSDAADRFQTAINPEIRRGGNWTDAILLIIGAARSLFLDGAFIESGHRWQRVAAASQRFDAFARYRALVAYSHATEPPPSAIRDLLDKGALKTEFPGVSLTRLRANRHLDQPISSGELDTALAANRDETCRWLYDNRDRVSLDTSEGSVLAPNSVEAYLWSECFDTERLGGSVGTPESTSVAAQWRRARRLFDLVRYDDAFDVLTGASLDSVESQKLTCHVRFRLARIQDRRDNFDSASAHYRYVTQNCGDGTATTPHIRSLYALGDYHIAREHFDKSSRAFKKILEVYPNRSHADDALLFLGRIAREQNDRARERKLLTRALENYPNGDMVFEFAWEYLERFVDDDQWNKFLTEYKELSLPSHDEQPYSQGRLGYFRGRAYQQLERPDDAAKQWAKTWRQYPFSFYGYLSRMHIGPDDQVSTDLRPVGPQPASWFLASTEKLKKGGSFDPVTGTRLLSAAGFFRLGLMFERGTLPSHRADSDALWRRAALWHRLGHYHHSHNVARRQIDERPWVEPARGRRMRWTVAYPAAFQGLINRAVLAEAREHADTAVDPALVSALMREESAFLEGVESWAGALGLMQLMPATARGHASVIDGDADRNQLLKPWPNIRIGVAHLFMLAERFDNHPVKMIAAYNAGGGAVSSWPDDHTDIAVWVEDIPYRQTRHYVKRVMGSYAAYQWLEDRPLDPRMALMP